MPSLKRAALIAAAVIWIMAAAAGCSRPEALLNVLDEARAAYGKGHFTEAERLYERYLQTEPNGAHRWEAWSRLLDIARGVLSDNDRAAALLDSMFLEFGEDKDKGWELLSALATTNEAMRRWPEALENWKRCLDLPKLDPIHLPEIHLHMARLYRFQREYDVAQQSLKKCSKTAQSPQVKLECLYEWAQTIDYEHKRAQAQSVEAPDGKSGYDPTSNLERMKQLLEEIRSTPDLAPDRAAQTSFLLAEVYEGLGKKAEAARLLRAILSTYPNPKVIEALLENLKRDTNREKTSPQDQKASQKATTLKK